MTVTLNLGSKSIRLVSQKGSWIDSWATFDLPSGLIKDGLILDGPGVAALLKERFRILKLPVQSVKVCLTGHSFIYRVLTLPNVKSLNLRSAIERATQKEISLPIDSLYLDWQIIRQDEKEFEVFVMGLPRQLVDSLIATFKLAGLSMSSLELKALSLARAANQAHALVVDCEPEAFEILIVRDSAPVTIHRVTPKNEMSTLEDNLNQMITELNRTIDFYNLNNPENPLTKNTPVVLSGSLCDDARSREIIAQGIGGKVDYFQTRLAQALDFPISTFAANLGMLSPTQNGFSLRLGKAQTASGGNIDILKGRRRTLSHPVRLKTLTYPALICAALILLATMSFARQGQVTRTNQLRFDSTEIDQALSRANLALSQANQLQSQIDALNTETEMIREERQELAGRGEMSTNLKNIYENLPEGASIIQINALPDKITIDGHVLNRADVFLYIHNLEKSSYFSEVRVGLIDTAPESEGGGYIFKLVIER